MTRRIVSALTLVSLLIAATAAVAQEKRNSTAPNAERATLDRTVLPIPEPKYPPITELDAYIIGNTVTGPEDSYKYALGQPIKRPLSPSTLFSQIIESNPTPPFEENPTPPIEQDATPPIEQDPTPPTEENPTPPIEEHPTPPMLKRSMRPADSSGVTHAALLWCEGGTARCAGPSHIGLPTEPAPGARAGRWWT